VRDVVLIAALELVGPILLEMVLQQVAGPTVKQLVAGVMNQPEANAHAVAIAVVPAARHEGIAALPAVEVVSATPGRLRLQVAGARDQAELAHALTDAARALPGVRQAEANVRTGRLLVQFDPNTLTSDAVVTAVEQARARAIGCARRGAGSTRDPASRHLAAVV
jgi:hypothetical protein